MKKRITAVFLIISLVMALCLVPAAAADDGEAEKAAEALYDLGLFMGKGDDENGNPNFDLGSASTRNEAVTMLVRLLGKEEEAKTGTWETPFTDVPNWAKPYVGYAYANGLTKGTGEHTFGGNDLISVSQYLTFALRALGYDSSKDFKWNKAWELSDKIGITHGEYNASSEFVRGDMAIISYNALGTEVKDSDTTLLETITGEPADSELAGTYDVVLWTSGAAAELTEKQIEAFNKSNKYGIKFNYRVEAVSEGDAANEMIVDVDSGADIYCFAQDQFARLVAAGALSRLDDEAAAAVKAENSAGVVGASTAGGELYAYPMTSDNGYFMYYDKRFIPEEDADSLEKIIADCEAADRQFGFDMTSAWYMASWFFATGCVSQWTTEADSGNGGLSFTVVNDTFNSDKGLAAAKGMKKLMDSPCYISTSMADELDSSAAVIVSGTWAYNTAAGILGENLGVAELPSFEVDGQSYHLGSFSGCKLMGVKPQEDAAKLAALHILAGYLTGEECQMERYNELSWGPANLNAQKSEAVMKNPGLAALLAQSAYSTPQGQIPGSWWDIAATLAREIGAAADEAGLKAALQNYDDCIRAVSTGDNG